MTKEKIKWTEVYSRLPWVKRLPKGEKCTGFMSHTPMKAIYGRKGMTEEEFIALRQKYSCKNSARWSFKGSKPRGRLAESDCSGTYCWKHLIHGGIYGSMREEARTLRWFKKHDPDIYEIIRPRSREEYLAAQSTSG